MFFVTQIQKLGIVGLFLVAGVVCAAFGDTEDARYLFGVASGLALPIAERASSSKETP